MSETRPVGFLGANKIMRGYGDVADLPIHDNGENFTSCWRIPFLKRLKVLITGRVYLVIRGRSHPPVWIDTEAFGKGEKP